jgi:hypothetical protein
LTLPDFAEMSANPRRINKSLAGLDQSIPLMLRWIHREPANTVLAEGSFMMYFLIQNMID